MNAGNALRAVVLPLMYKTRDMSIKMVMLFVTIVIMFMCEGKSVPIGNEGVSEEEEFFGDVFGGKTH